MKKILIMFLLLSLFLVGCSETDDNESKNKEISEISTVVDTDGSEEIIDLEQEEDVVKNNEPEVVEPEPDATTKTEASIQESVLLESNGIVITAKELKYDSLFGPELKVSVENNSDTDVTIQTRHVSVNGVMMDPIFSMDVSASKKANDSITFFEYQLEEAGITTIKDIELAFHIFNTESWEGIYDSDAIVITTDASDYTQTYDDSGVLAIDQNGLRIVAKTLDSTESFWGADLYLYMENNTEQDITIQVRDVSINGYMVDAIFSSEIVSGKKAYDTITFLESDLAENDITEINDLELYFHIFDTHSWETILDTDAISISFE